MDKYGAKKEMLKMLKELVMSSDDVGMMDKLNNMKKVTVASDSKEGLEAGLEKAKEVVENKEELLEESDVEESEGLSKEELQAKIDEYKKMLAEME